MNHRQWASEKKLGWIFWTTLQHANLTCNQVVPIIKLLFRTVRPRQLEARSQVRTFEHSPWRNGIVPVWGDLRWWIVRSNPAYENAK
jgi:hypothetical protein